MKIRLCDPVENRLEQAILDGSDKVPMARILASKLLLVMVLLLSISCSAQKVDCSNTKNFRGLQTLAESIPFAQRDADIAISKGDHRLLGVYGFTADIPGVSGVLGEASERMIISEYGVRMIEGTSDTPCDMDIYYRVHKYAKAYNQYLMGRLRLGVHKVH